jgi:ectoine hydroxylase-related dioxygenase (phytanoyl-CoA dioxygenase family)
MPKIALAELRRAYRRDGFVIARALFDDSDVSMLRGACDRLAKHLGKYAADGVRAQTRPGRDGVPVIDRLDPVCDLDPDLAKALDHTALMTLLAGLTGEPVRRFKDKLIWKGPGVGGYELHQDYTFWNHVDVPAECMLTAAVAVDRADAETGAMKLYPGLHDTHVPAASSAGGIFSPGAGVLSRESLCDVVPVSAAMAPGDVLVFHALTPHESGPNRAARSRRMLMGSYCAARFGSIRDRFYPGYRASIVGD